MTQGTRFVCLFLSVLWVGSALAGNSKLEKLGNPKNPDNPIQVGYLEVVWGDPAGVGPERLSVTLVNDSGRTPLDAEQAMVAAEDLISLAGQEVAVYQSKPTGPIEAMVPTGAGRAMSEYQATPQVHNWVTLACKFANDPHEPVSVGWLNHKYGRMRGHIGHYWHEVSYGTLWVRGRTHGWFTLPRPRAHYLIDGVLDTHTLGLDCLQAASERVDFSDVDGVNIALNREAGNFAYGGRLCPNLAWLPDPCMRMTWLPPFGYRSMRVMMHEMGHAYTWPHSDNSDGDENTYDNVWDIMSASNPGPSHPMMGSYPHYPTIWHRHRLGWIPPQRIETVYERPRMTRLVHLDWANNYTSTGKHLLIVRQNPPRDRDGNVTQPQMGVHYTLEARKPSGFDRNLPGRAVIIHRLTHGTSSSRPIAQDADVPPATRNNNPGSMFTEGETWTPQEGFATVRILRQTPHGFWVAVGPVR